MADDLESGGSTRPPSAVVFEYADPDQRTGLDANGGNITKWVINHHIKNLIEELEEPKPSMLADLFSIIYRGLSRAFNHGSKLNQQNGGLPLQQREKRFRISFAELQRMRIRQLHCELVQDVIRMRAEGSAEDSTENSDSPRWETRLKEYSRSYQQYKMSRPR